MDKRGEHANFYHTLRFNLNPVIRSLLYLNGEKL